VFYEGLAVWIPPTGRRKRAAEGDVRRRVRAGARAGRASPCISTRTNGGGEMPVSREANREEVAGPKDLGDGGGMEASDA